MPLDSRVVDARVHLVYPGSIPGVASNKIKDLRAPIPKHEFRVRVSSVFSRAERRLLKPNRRRELLATASCLRFLHPHPLG
jgi:hypothetical protein